ncbi:PQQ-binding-like beta-propeller repeat protein [Acidobacteriota bacterium]
MSKRVLGLAVLVVIVHSLGGFALEPGELKWAFQASERIYSTPAIGRDGTIYFATVDDGMLYAVTPEGALKWSFQTPDLILATPSIGPDGTIYIGSWDGNFYAVSPAGERKWTVSLGGVNWQTGQQASVGADGTVYVRAKWYCYGCSTRPGMLKAVNPDGTTKWTKWLRNIGGNGTDTAVSIAPDGVIYLPDFGLQAVYPNGDVKWSVPFESWINVPPAIGADGTVYFGTGGSGQPDALYAFNPDGTEKWRYSDFIGFYGPAFYSAPTIGPDGTIYFGCDDGYLYAVNPEGTTKWRLRIADRFLRTSPSIAADGTIYLGYGMEIMAISPAGQLRWKSSLGNYLRSSPTLGPDGTLYVGTTDGKLLAVYTGVGGLADSPWPTLGQNSGHTGRNAKRDVHPLQLGASRSYDTLPWDANLFSVEVDEGRNLLVEVKPSDGVHAMMLDAEFGEIIQPSGGTFSTKTTTVRGGYEVLITPTQTGTYYLAVLGTEVDEEGGTYEIVARYVEAYLSDLLPRAAGNGGLASLSIKGLRFEPGMAVELSGPGLSSLNPDRVDLISSTELTALFDLEDVPTGIYDLDVTWPGGHSERLEGSFTVTPGIGPRLEVELEAPAAVRIGRKYTAWLRYENSGDADMPSPLLSVRSNVAISARRDSVGGQRVEILGVGSLAAPEWLRSGELRSVPVYFTAPLDGTRPIFQVFEADDSTTPVDWLQQKEIMRPPGMDAAEWDALWPDLIARFGETWSDYQEVLRSDAARIGARGTTAHDVQQIVAFETRLARGLPVAAIVGTVYKGRTNQPLVNVLVRAISVDGAVVREAYSASSPGGQFIFENLPNGIYEIYVEGSFFDPTPSVNIIDNDVTGLRLHAFEFLRDEEPEEPGIPRHDPSVATGDSGEVFLVWSNGVEIWWSKDPLEGFGVSGPIPNAKGSKPVVVYAPELLDDGTTPGLLVAWESDVQPSIIEWAVGRLTENGIEWSNPVAFTEDAFDDFGIGLTVDPDGAPLIVWLQQDLEVEDDSDLYFDLIDPSSAIWAAIEKELAPAEGLFGEFSTEFCVGVPEIDIGTGLPRWIPILGGPYRFMTTGSLCGGLGCDPSLEGKVGVKAEFGELVEVKGDLSGKAEWRTKKAACKYVFKQGEVGGEIEVEVNFLTPIPLFVFGVPLGTAKVGVVGKGSVSGSLFWKSSLSGWPDRGEVTPSAAVGLKGKIELLGGGLGGKVTGTAGVSAVLEIPPGSYKFKGHCVEIKGEGKAGWGLFKIKFEKTWGDGCSKSLLSVYPFSKTESINQRFTLFQNYVFEEVPVAESLEYEKATLTGTGSTYEGFPVLGDISGDLYSDGRPVVTRSSTREVVVVWAKDIEASSLGGIVYAATYEGAMWSAPDAVTFDAAFVKDPAAVFDDGNALMVVWSSASNDGLDYELSTVEEILTASEDSDIYYALRSGGIWTVPAPLELLTGRDEYPALAAGGEGAITAVWLNTGEEGVRLLGSHWAGGGWSAPEEISSATMFDPPRVFYDGLSPVVVWAQDWDDDPETFDRWTLYASRWEGTGWSAPQELESEGSFSEMKSMLAVTASGILKSFSLGSPPEGCCEEPPEEPLPPEPPGELLDEADSESLTSQDPNEKIAAQGFGDEHLIQAGDELPYEVHFENLATATAPAQEVFILDCLDPDLDWLSFRLHDVVFADMIVANTTTAPVFSERVTIPDYRSGVEKMWWVDVETSFNLLSGCFRTTLRQLDPETGELPEDPFAGILPPEDGTGSGQGHLSYSVNTKANLEDGTVVKNRASIIFDVNEPILTNEVFNTIGEPQFRLSVSTLGDGAGSVTSSPGGIDCGDVCEALYIEGTVVELNHFAESGSDFSGWNGDADCSDGVVTMSANVGCEAIFEIFNQPPVADAGQDQLLSADAQCEAAATLDGSLSSDPDDDPLTFLWQGSFGDFSEAVVDLFLPLGTHEFTLTVTDDYDASDSDTVMFTVEDGTPPFIEMAGDPEIAVECMGSYTEPGATAVDNCDVDIQVGIGGDEVDPATPGTYVVTFDAADVSGNQAETLARVVSVVDTTTPAVTAIEASPATLWPPNHKMKGVTVSVSAADSCDTDPPICRITGVVSNEPETGCGSGNRQPDSVITGNLTADLRAERCGEGDDRVYTIQVTCTDGAGNGSLATTEVVVPHDQGGMTRRGGSRR